MPLELGGTIDENGKLSVFREGDLRQWINAHKNQQIVLSLKLKGKKRSSPQNAYYWGVVVEMIKDRFNQLGNDFDADETHDFLKNRFNAKEIEAVQDHFIEIPMSTARLDTKDFMDYLAKIQQFASQFLGIYIPEPNEQLEVKF